MDKQFVGVQQQVIFESDAVTSAQALTSNASTPTEVSNKFGSISYNKGEWETYFQSTKIWETVRSHPLLDVDFPHFCPFISVLGRRQTVPTRSYYQLGRK